MGSPKALVSVLLGLAACGGGDHGGSGKTVLKADIGLDLSHVIGFAIADTTSMRACMPSTLYAVMDDGSMVITTVTEQSGGSGSGSATCTTGMMTERATSIFDTPMYDVIGYSGGFDVTNADASHTQCYGVILRKSDGALFCLTAFGAADFKADGTGQMLLFTAKELQR